MAAGERKQQFVRISRLFACVSHLSLTIALLGGCGGYTPDAIVEQTPRGLIGGGDWSMVSADVIHLDGHLVARLHATERAPCAPNTGVAPHILFLVPEAPGEYPLRFDQASVIDGTAQVVNFVTAEADNVISSQGLIVVESISDTEVSLGVIADAENNSVNGRFTAPICPAD